MASHPRDFEALLARLTEEIEGSGLAFMLIGGQAVLLHGAPRLTEDVDLTLGAGPTALPTVLGVCDRLGLDPLPRDPASFVEETFVLPAAEPETGLRVDIIFSTTPYERQAIGRAVRVEIRGVPVPFATAEDLLIHKLFAARPRDLEDAASVVRRRGDELDWDYLTRWVESFAEVPGREAMTEHLEGLRADRGTD